MKDKKSALRNVLGVLKTSATTIASVQHSPTLREEANFVTFFTTKA